MLGLTAAFVAALVTAAPAATQEAAQPPAAQKAEPRSSSREPQTTRTVDATRGMRLALDNFAGEVIVRAWDKNAVRVDARHPRGAIIQVERKGNEIEISTSRDWGGLSGSIDYEISVPSWMPLRLTGTYLFVSIEGVQADIQAETVRGDVAVRGGAGSVSLKSIEGDGSLEGATGRIELSSVGASSRSTASPPRWSRPRRSTVRSSTTARSPRRASTGSRRTTATCCFGCRRTRAPR